LPDKDEKTGEDLYHGSPASAWENDIPDFDPWPTRQYTKEDQALHDSWLEEKRDYVRELKRRRTG
jgi:hypothetical protein